MKPTIKIQETTTIASMFVTIIFKALIVIIITATITAIINYKFRLLNLLVNHFKNLLMNLIILQYLMLRILHFKEFQN